MNPRPELWRRTPGQGKYGRPERERRFLLAAEPPASAPPRWIEDRYLDDTSLRLRRLTAGGERVFKLTQKIRTTADDPADVLTTNMYLIQVEYDLLRLLPGASLTKSRCLVKVSEWTHAIDTFTGPLAWLQLAEIEVPTLDLPASLPDWLGQEVTHVDAFSGGALARTADWDMATLQSLAVQ